VIFPEADTAGAGRVHDGTAQPRQLTSARPFAPRTKACGKVLDNRTNLEDHRKAGREMLVRQADRFATNILPVIEDIRR
jgi:hypothetical protein